MIRFLVTSLPLLKPAIAQKVRDSDSLYTSHAPCCNVVIQYLVGLFGAFEQLAVQTQPFQIREVVASEVMRLWPLALASGEGVTSKCCELAVGLLQDADTDVRQEMANAVSGLIAS